MHISHSSLAGFQFQRRLLSAPQLQDETRTVALKPLESQATQKTTFPSLLKICAITLWLCALLLFVAAGSSTATPPLA
jgi:hypothetical protein